MLTVEDFIRPQHDDHFIFTDIRNVMRPAWNGFHDLRRLRAGAKLVRHVTFDMAEAEPRCSFDDEKFLGLGMVVMAAAGDARMGRKERELAGIGRL